MEAAAQSVTHNKYLTFSLGQEEYGVEILKVREIIGVMDITPVPQTPKYVKGVINLRGKVIPVVDLRLKFKMEERSYDERTCIIVVEIKTKGSTILMGVVVDSVSEVMPIPSDQIEPPPEMGGSIKSSYIMGMAKTKDDVKILLDIDRSVAIGGMGGLLQEAS